MNLPVPRSKPIIGETRSLRGFKVKPRFEEVVRHLGNQPKAKPKPKVEQKIRVTEQIALDLNRPAAVYGIWRRNSLTRLELPSTWNQDADYIALAAVTISDALENEVSSLSSQGTLARATILDAYGSELAEVAADTIDAIICREASSLGLNAERRISPGYEDWPIEQQRPLFDALLPEDIGIHLSPSLIMIPKKSISFAKPLGAKLAEEDQQTRKQRCNYCDLTTCKHRKPRGDTR